MATERITFTPEQKEAWIKAKELLKTGMSSRSLHIAMSELRAENGRKHKGPIETLPKHPGKLEEYKAIYAQEQIAAKVKQWKEYLRDPGKQKLYIIVRDDLSPAQKAVQASHAAAQFQKEHPNAPWINGTMVLMQPVTNDNYYKRFEAPRSWRQDGYDPFEEYIKGCFYGTDFKTYWREPDLDNKLTAVAILSVYHNEQNRQRPGIKLI